MGLDNRNNKKVHPETNGGKGYIAKDGSLNVDHPDWKNLSREDQLRLLHK